MGDRAGAGAVLIWGGGGHGRVVADLVRLTGGRVVAVADAVPGKVDRTGFGPDGPLIVGEADVLAAVAAGHLPAGAETVALGLGRNSARWSVFGRLPARWMPPLVHPSASIALDAVLGSGSIVLAGAVVNAGARLGAAVVINSGAIVEHECVIGDGAHLSPGAVLCGRSTIGHLAWVGAGATVVPGIVIGDRVTVGAGACVLANVPDDDRVVGVPARSLRSPALGSNP